MVLKGCNGKYIRMTVALMGSTSMGSGLWLRFSESTKGFFETEIWSSSPSVVVPIALGILMLISVILSCSEKKCVVQMFCAFVVILAVAEVTVGVLIYVYKKEIGESIVGFYENMGKKSAENQAIGVTLKFIHTMLQCCGKVTSACPDNKWPSCPDGIKNFVDSKAPLVMGAFIGTGVLLIASLVCLMVFRRKLSQNDSTAKEDSGFNLGSLLPLQ